MALAQAHESLVGGDSVQPGLRAGPAVKGGQASIGVEATVLEHSFGFEWVSQPSQRQAVDLRRILVHESGERGAVAVWSAWMEIAGGFRPSPPQRRLATGRAAETAGPAGRQQRG
jgi:hypothetical protein